MTVGASAAAGADAVALFKQYLPDVTLMDLKLGRMSGLEAIRAIRRYCEAAHIVVLTMYDGDEDVYRALEAGAATYLLKDMLSDDLINIIREVCAGRRPLAAGIQARLDERSTYVPLTPREIEVLDRVRLGLRNKEIGGALGIMNCHDLVYAAADAQLGMPEILRGSFGQLVTSTLLHGGLPVKKLAHIALLGRNITGQEADALGIISQAVPAGELEEFTIGIAREIASRHLAPLEHHKITVQMGRDLSLSQAIQLDQLVGQRLRRSMDPLGDVEGYLKSQKGGANLNYKRPDVQVSAISDQGSELVENKRGKQ